MRFTCKRARLAEVATLVGQAVASKSTRKTFECLRIEALENAVELTGTDLEVAMRVRIEDGIEVGEKGVAVVPAQLFAGVVREIADETLTVSVDRQKLTLDTDGGFFELECEDPAQYPEVPAFPEEATGEIAAADLRALVHKSTFAAGREAARYVLNGVRLMVDGDGLRFVATDGRRLAVLVRPIEQTGTSSSMTEGEGAIVGVKGLQHFERVAAGVEGSVSIAINQRFVALRTSTAEVTARVMDGTFPDHNQIIPKETPAEAVVPVVPLAARLRQAARFASVESQAVRLTFRRGELEIAAAGGEGRASVKLEIEYDGAEETIGFNPAFLSDALKVVDGETIRIGFTNRNSAVRISDDTGFLYVLMPVLIEG